MFSIFESKGFQVESDKRPVFGTILRQVMNIYNDRKAQLEQQNRIAANRLEKDNNSFTLEEDGRNVTYI